MTSPYKNKPNTAQGGRRGNSAKGNQLDSHMVMIKKYKDDDFRKTQFVPQSTLLEPNNVIPSWEFGGEEKKEVSTTMRKLRQKYDNIHKTVLSKQNELEELKKKLEMAKNDETTVEDSNYRKNSGLKNTKGQLDTLKDNHDMEMMLQRTYKHMINRMQQDLIACQISANELHESHKSKMAISEEETDKNRKAKQAKEQAQHRLDEFMEIIDQDHRQRQDRISSLQKSIKNKEDALRRRVERVRRQQVIAESAANENKDSNELKMQENFLAQKLWSAFLKSKMEKEMNRTYEIEQGFQKIRAETGITDVQEIVQKFLTRETNYSQLLMAVGENEIKIDKLRTDNQAWRDKLHELQIHHNEASEQRRRFNPELAALDNKIQDQERKKEKVEDVNKKVQLVNDQVTSWCQRVIQKIDQQFSENISAYTDKTMAFKFEKIMQAVCKQLEQIIMEEDEEDRGYITVKDFMNDFGTDEFLSKNRRIRPDSSVTRDFDDKNPSDGVGHFSRIGGPDGGVGGPDDEEHFNDQTNFELDKDRNNVKIKREEFLQRKKLEEEKAKKKRN